MKRIYIFALSMLPLMGMQAQDTYLNDRATNTSDVIGTARYVGMGGAMGALGADISAISNNPASIGLMRRGTLSFTLGGQINDAKPAFGDSRGSFTFDQIGFVLPFGDVSDDTRLNFAFNYQKKINYNQGIYTSQNLGGLSQGDMFAWIANSIYRQNDKGEYYFDSPFYDNLYLAGFFGEYTNDRGDTYFRNVNAGETGYYYRNSSGSLQGYDFNLSGSVSDRWFWGLTFGIDHMIYRHHASYEEVGDDSYILYQDQKLKGHGFNIKAGAIIRPIEDSPLRFGLAVETPSWYVLKHTAEAGLSVIDNQGRYTQAAYMDDDNYLEYNVYAPWKFRASLGSTVEDYLAWDVEYEYAMNNYTKMGYPDNYDDYYYEDGSAISMEKDQAMNEMTKANIRGVHNIRAGLELKPLDKVAVRIGYNFFSKPYKDGARLDQTCNTPAYDWSTSTEYINLGATHLFTLGVGYQGKHFFADLAYKYRVQRGDYYSFDDQFTSLNESFIDENPQLAGKTLSPTEVNLDRHNIAVTLGYRF
ncbi:MAG: hypothetical protein K6A32_07465 [Bacteroidales bacterium]|nr:hypothetical protein [Bacteroidales bacterium]